MCQGDIWIDINKELRNYSQLSEKLYRNITKSLVRLYCTTFKKRRKKNTFQGPFCNFVFISGVALKYTDWLFFHLILWHWLISLQNTYTNADKLLEAAEQLAQTGECDPEEIFQAAHQLEDRIQDFVRRVEQRKILLDMSVSFHTHVKEVKLLLSCGDNFKP